MEVVDGPASRNLALNQLPFVIGRSLECSLVLSQAYVSRRHAEITVDGGQFFLTDQASRYGTFVNGERITSHVLSPRDIIQLGSLEGPRLRFLPDGPTPSPSDLLSQLQQATSQKSDLEKLHWFLQAARELNSAGAIESVLTSLLTTTLSLARMERGYVFLANPHGDLELQLGMDAHGHRLHETETISRTAIRQATEGADQFIVTDTLTGQAGFVPESIAIHSIRTVICIPLRHVRETRRNGHADDIKSRRVFGVLYLDSHFEPKRFTDVDHELMNTIAREAAALVENAQLAAIEEQARLHNEELQIAASIQQGLMAVKIPDFPFARVQAYSLPCSAVGGDFFDVIPAEDALNVVLVDVSGKGISAAILASTLQGMLYIQLQAARSLSAIAATTNDYLCTKNVGKYATMLLLRLQKDGSIEYMNCGHIQPRICSEGHVSRLQVANLPIGLIATAEYTTGTTTLQPGARITLVSDGFTEAEDPTGEFFGEDRLDTAVSSSEMHGVIEHMRHFCADHPATDDCTIVQVSYSGQLPAPPHIPEAQLADV